MSPITAKVNAWSLPRSPPSPEWSEPSPAAALPGDNRAPTMTPARIAAHRIRTAISFSRHRNRPKVHPPDEHHTFECRRLDERVVTAVSGVEINPPRGRRGVRSAGLPGRAFGHRHGEHGQSPTSEP